MLASIAVVVYFQLGRDTEFEEMEKWLIENTVSWLNIITSTRLYGGVEALIKTVVLF